MLFARILGGEPGAHIILDTRDPSHSFAVLITKKIQFTAACTYRLGCVTSWCCVDLQAWLCNFMAVNTAKPRA